MTDQRSAEERLKIWQAFLDARNLLSLDVLAVAGLSPEMLRAPMRSEAAVIAMRGSAFHPERSKTGVGR